MTVMDTIRKVQARDEGTARLLLEMALYDAVCDEADRVGPQLEAEVLKRMGEKAAQGLKHLAREPVTKTSVELADGLVRMLEISKADDDPRTPYWDARGENGQFVSGSGRSGIFNVLGFATGRKDEQMGLRVKETMGNLVSPEDGNYGRLRTLGQGLVASNDPNLQPAGTVARLIGDIGPEAQKALEPGIRRTAYRYRGTERRPDPVLQQKAAELVAELQGPGMDQQRLRMSSDLGVSALINQVPDRETAAISLAAGKMPPSVGMMFDGRGKLVSEAQGFNGDHYLPFDLSNLKRLKGGSYVRTRTTGGLTDEDIYTGLMTGARHMTVVSNSGVFSMEFEPDLRGGRRYSDKARQMVDRYARLVSAIGSGELYQNKLPREQSQALREKALQAAGGNAEQAKVIFQRTEKEALAAAAFVATDDDTLMEQAEAAVAADPAKRQGSNYARAVKEEFNALKAKSVQTEARQYRLDGEGYKAALKALKTEFPYFIRSARFLPLQDYMDDRRLTQPGTPRRPRGGTDMGYTPRNGLDPSRAGVRDKDGNRKILGAPPGARQTAAAASTAPASGGAGAAATAGAPGAARTIETVTAQGLENKRSELNTALQLSLKARTAVSSPEFVTYALRSDGKPLTETEALGESPDAYVQWLAEQYNDDWVKVTDHILKSTDPRVLDKVLASADVIQGVLRRGGAEGFDQFDAAKKVLTEIKTLKQPFVPGNDLYAEPAMGQTAPQALSEITALPLTNEALVAYGIEHPEAMNKATEWAKAKRTPEDLRKEIAGDAKNLKQLRELAETGNLPLSLPDTPEVREMAAQVKELGDKHPLAVNVADSHRAWALMRLHEVMEITGANRSGTGAADPFARPAGPAKEVAAKSSTPSRLVWHDRDSALAQAVAKALSPRSAPLLRVKLPASR